MPHPYEGWNRIKVVRLGNCRLVNLNIYFAYDIPHDCATYHCESIQDHARMCAQLYNKEALNDNFDMSIAEALYYHDVGKLYTKAFLNTKGELTKVAHYYDHERVSTYMYLTSAQYLKVENGLEIVYLIQYHMEPYHRTGTAWDRFARDFDKDFIEKLLTVHEYDKRGRRYGSIETNEH